jgi:ribonuclease E
LRLRDLAGLIVIDFIDMDEGRNNRTVERRLKEALKYDRARIQVGRISHFGLLEMSRQRIRTSVLESSTEKCPVCGGSGHVRSVSSVALQLLRAIEEMLIKGATHNLTVRTRAEVALYVLNHKRAHLRALEERFRIIITVSADPGVTGQQSYVIDRGEQVHTPEAARNLAAQQPQMAPPVEEIEDELAEAGEHPEEQEFAASEAEAETPAESERDGGRRRRRRRGRGGRGRSSEPRENVQQAFTHDTVPEHATAHEDRDAGSPEEEGFGQPKPRREGGSFADGEPREGRRRRRRGRRGGRRNRQRGGEAPFRPGETGPEPELQHAVEDLDRPSRYESSPSEFSSTTPGVPYSPPPEEHAAPPVEYSATAASTQESSRRRSTVREPVSFPTENTATPSPVTSTPAPVISSTTSEESAAPKRGWWGKRLLGDKD